MTIKTPPNGILPVLRKVKDTYCIWFSYYQILPKSHRYSLGVKIDNLFIELIEAISVAGFLKPEEKQPWVRLAIRKSDTLKVLLMILWESKSIDDKKYINLSEKIDNFGRDLGGWSGKLIKENSPVRAGEK